MKRIIRKFGALIITLLLVSFIAFVAFNVIPGDSAVTKLGTNATKEAIEALREELGLNDNLFLRYANWLRNALKGDFGTSIKYNIPVNELIKDRLPVTIWLAILSITMITLFAIPLGLLSVKGKEGLGNGISSFLIHTLMAIPPFFLGILITLLFGIILEWFVPGEFIKPKANFLEFIKYMIYPSLAIAIPQIAMVVKFLRNSVLHELTMDYVRTAKSKGSTSGRVLYRHVLKNAFIPIITFLGMVLADVLAGSIIVEQVFSLPGLGRLLITSIANRDFMVVQGIMLYIVTMVVVINFVVDLIYQRIDPRIRL